MKVALVNITVAAVLLAAAAPTAAGIANAPLPSIAPGQSTRLLFFIPGVTKNNNLETIVMCTNLEKNSAATIALEVFDADATGPLNDIS